MPNSNPTSLSNLSADDHKLKEKVDMYVHRILSGITGLRKNALEELSKMLDSTNSLRFVQPHFESLIDCYMKQDQSYKFRLFDFLSFLALTKVFEGGLESLKRRLLGSEGDICSLGHSDIWMLAGQIAQEYAKRQRNAETDDLKKLVQRIVDFFMKVKRNHILIERSDWGRTDIAPTCYHLADVARCLALPDAMIGFEIAFKLFLAFEEYYQALIFALLLDNLQFVKHVLTSCDDSRQKYEFCYILSRQNITLNLDEEIFDDPLERYEMQRFVNNSNLGEHFLELANRWKVIEPISPENICKSHLLDREAHRNSGKRLTPRKNLARIFLDTFVNARSGRGEFMKAVEKFTKGPLGCILNKNDDRWLTSRKRVQFKASAVASMALFMIWDPDSYVALTKEYRLSTDSNILAGALLGVGIVNSRLKNDSALPILDAHYNSEDPLVRIASTMGSGIAYAGTQNEMIRNKLIPMLNNVGERLDVVAFAAISLGLIYVGSCNQVIAESIISAINGRGEVEDPISKLLPLSLGLLYLGAEGRVEDVGADVSQIDDEDIREYCSLTLLSCAYAGTRDFRKVPELMSKLLQSLEKGGNHQELAVLGIAMVLLARCKEDGFVITFVKNMLPSYTQVKIRRAFPLALGLLCISDPKDRAIEELSERTYDADEIVASASIISLGLIGAGTCNAEIAGKLNNLSLYYYKGGVPLFCVRLAQGLLHLGKGLLNLATYPCNEFMLSRVGLGGLLIFLHACLNNLTTSRSYNFIIYFLVLAIQVKMVET